MSDVQTTGIERGQAAFHAGLVCNPEHDTDFCSALSDPRIVPFRAWRQGWVAAKTEAMAGVSLPPLTLPTYDEMLAFLRKIYKFERLDGRDQQNPAYGYRDAVVRSHLRDLEQNGYGMISHHESRTGDVICWNVALEMFGDRYEAEGSMIGQPYFVPGGGIALRGV